MKKYKEAIFYITFIIIAFVFVIAKTYPQIINIINLEKNISQKSFESNDLERKLEVLKSSDQEKKTLTGQLKQIYKPEISGLDAESSFTVIFDDVIDMAKYNGIKVYSIQYTYNPPEDVFVKGDAAKYNVCQLNMEIISDYQDLESFLKELYKYPYLINIDKIVLTPYTKNKKILLVELQVKLYSSK